MGLFTSQGEEVNNLKPFSTNQQTIGARDFHGWNCLNSCLRNYITPALNRTSLIFLHKLKSKYDITVY